MLAKGTPGMRPAADEMLPDRRAIVGTTARIMRTRPKKFVSMISRSQSDGIYSTAP